MPKLLVVYDSQTGNRFGMRTIGSGLTMLYAPDNNGLEQCRNLGKTVAEKIVNM